MYGPRQQSVKIIPEADGTSEKTCGCKKIEDPSEIKKEENNDNRNKQS